MPLKIVHFTVGRPRPDVADGVSKTAYYLTQALATCGHEVHSFALTERSPYPIPGVVTKAYPPSKRLLTVPAPLVRDLTAYRPDVVCLHSVYTPANTALARQLYARGIPYTVRPAGGLGADNERRRRYLKLPYKHLFERPMLNRALFIHSVGDTRAIEAYGVRAPIVSTPKGVDPSLRPTHVKDHLLAHVPQAQGKLVFGFLGRLDPLHKGLDLLLEGFAASRLEDALLVLIGPDHHGGEEALKALSDRLGARPRVVFARAAYGKTKFDLLAGIDVFAHTSRWEGGIPHAVLEAAALGKPCLVTEGADPQGLLSDYGGGVRVDSGAAAIAEGLKTLAGYSEGQRRAMGMNARRLIEEQTGWDKAASLLVASINEHKAKP